MEELLKKPLSPETPRRKQSLSYQVSPENPSADAEPNQSQSRPETPIRNTLFSTDPLSPVPLSLEETSTLPEPLELVADSKGPKQVADSKGPKQVAYSRGSKEVADPEGAKEVAVPEDAKEVAYSRGSKEVAGSEDVIEVAYSKGSEDAKE